VLCTTDAATDRLTHHQAILHSRWDGVVRPTFRPDAVTHLLHPAWRENIKKLSEVSGIVVDAYPKFIQALEERRVFFKSMGARATDHAVESAYTTELRPGGGGVHLPSWVAREGECRRRTPVHGAHGDGSARMSLEDGLVMQLHVGALRDHNDLIYRCFGTDKGADIPVPGEFTRNLRPLLNRYGIDSRLTLILFTLDESTYARELAPWPGTTRLSSSVRRGGSTTASTA